MSFLKEMSPKVSFNLIFILINFSFLPYLSNSVAILFLLYMLIISIFYWIYKLVKEKNIHDEMRAAEKNRHQETLSAENHRHKEAMKTNNNPKETDVIKQEKKDS